MSADRHSMNRVSLKEGLALAAFTLLLGLVAGALLMERRGAETAVAEPQAKREAAPAQRLPPQAVMAEPRRSFSAAPVAMPEEPATAEVITTWGDTLNPSNQVPSGRFKAFYFNSQQPRDVIASALVDDVGISYAWSEFHNIRSEDFGAYWVGRFHVAQPATRIANISQSWSKTRIIIDKKVVYEGGSDARVPYTLSQGDHLIEVEFLNNWHTTGLAVDFDGQPQTG